MFPISSKLIYDPLILYPETLLDRTFIVIEKEEKISGEVMALLTLFPLVLISACKSLRESSEMGLKHSFDPLVRDQSCQAHSFSFIENFPVFARGYEKLSERVTHFLEMLPKRLVENFFEHTYTSSFREIVQKSSLMEFLYEQDQTFEEIRKSIIEKKEDEIEGRSIFFSKSIENRDKEYCFDLLQMHLLTVSKRERKETIKPELPKIAITKKDKHKTIKKPSPSQKFFIREHTDVEYLKEVFPTLNVIADADLLKITINNQFYLSRRSTNLLLSNKYFITPTIFNVLEGETKEDFLNKSRSMSCFYSTKAVLDLMYKKYQLTVLKTKVLNQNGEEIGNSAILFRPNKWYKNQYFKWATTVEHAEHKDQIAWVVSGISISLKNVSIESYEKRLSSFLSKENFENILLANASKHNQFVGKQWKNLTVKDSIGNKFLQSNIKKANKFGFHKDDPRLFLVNHIYAEIVNIALDKTK